ncbi:putative amino acid transporter [Rosellinia necatrix]|uniref:Putative amino acid transporter n=1 Tax=Rosellinia necatrix TaxID=77044 RepID=A0A1W2TTM4_ROSNE|nr:putative amino acid transporter [Rosellinia necatrix]
MAPEGETRPLLLGTTPPELDNQPTTPSPLRNSVAAPDDDVVQGRGSAFSRSLGTAEAFAIVISIVIGSGVFTSPGSIDTNVPSPGAALVVWLVGGVLAWTGASTMAELGTAIPGEGGVQPYLRYIFGDVFGFLAAWTWVVAVMPATLAILSIVFVESIYSAAGVTGEAGRIAHKLLSVLVLVLVSIANSISTKTTTRLNGFFVLTKFAAVAAVVIAGLAVVIVQASHPDRDDVGGRDWFTKPWFGTRPTINPDESRTDWEDLSEWELLGHYSTALYGALWAYSGWDKAIYISAELSAPAKQLPLAINTAIPTIVLCFITANAAYYVLLPWDVVSTTDSVAVTAVTRLLGRAPGIAAAALICLVVAGSLLGNSFVAGRMAVAAARQGWLPRALARLGSLGGAKDQDQEDQDQNRRSQDRTASEDSDGDDSSVDNNKEAAVESDAPVNAIALSAALATLYVLGGSFRALLTFNGLGEYAFFFLAVLGAVVLRVREPGLRRPYRPPIAVPVIFALVSGFVVVRGALFAPALAALLVVLWGVGGVVYWMRGRGGMMREEGEEGEEREEEG